MAEKIVLAYSGGLDTSVAAHWLRATHGYDVVCLMIDLGNIEDVEGARERGLLAGAVEVDVVDAREDFLRYFALPGLSAHAVYEGQYPLATALGRPLIAKLLVDKAREVGATAVAHGCTGKGNDQVRFDISVRALAPDLHVIGTARDFVLTRDEATAYAAEHGIPLRASGGSSYSIDENIWGRAIECGQIEDPWNAPPDDAYAWTRDLEDTPLEPAIVTIGFERGRPVALDGQRLSELDLVQRLSDLAGEHGVGRIDMVENRLVGIKSREIYEAPAAITLLEAHRALEAITLSRPQQRLKERVAQEYADLIYNGLWFTRHHQDLAAYVQSTQRDVTGEVRMRLHRGHAVAEGRRAEHSLYAYELATYDAADAFDHTSALGFISIWGLPVEVQAREQLLPDIDPLRFATPDA